LVDSTAGAKLRGYGVTVTELSSFHRGKSAARAALKKRGKARRGTSRAKRI
jgi:hypothetical protein